VSTERLGISGRIAAAFQESRLTPLLSVVGLVLGILVVIITPKEEEPQIDVTMADVIVGFPGATVHEVESLIATPGEQILGEVEGVEHVYSMSRSGQAIITIEFAVGIPRQQALVRLYNQVFSNQDWFPEGLGAHPPIIKPKGIDDVPIMGLTLYDPSNRQSGEDLTRLAHALEVELKRVAGTRDVYTIGGIPDRVDVEFDPALVAGFGLSLDGIAEALQQANTAGMEGAITQNGVSIPLANGMALQTLEDVKNLVIGVQQDTAIFLQDVATVRRGETVADQSVQLGFGPFLPSPWRLQKNPARMRW